MPMRVAGPRRLVRDYRGFDPLDRHLDLPPVGPTGVVACWATQLAVSTAALSWALSSAAERSG